MPTLPIFRRLSSASTGVEETMETNQESLLDALDIQDEENGNLVNDNEVNIMR